MAASPSTERVVAILDFLGAHPDDTYSLSDLCRHTGVTKATAHSVLSTLVDAGYLLRHPVEKTYGLGPALVALGSAAAANRMRVVDFARPEMERLAAETGALVVASAVMGDEIVFLAKEGEPEPFSVSVEVGQRLPLVPPLGTVFLAWSDADEIDRWLRKLGPDAPERKLRKYRSAVEAVRERGYSIGLDLDAPVRLGAALEGDRRARAKLFEELSHGEYQLLELERAASYRLSHIAAPVFGPDGGVVLSLNLLGFGSRLPADRVPELADQLVAAALTVTKSIHGRAG